MVDLAVREDLPVLCGLPAWQSTSLHVILPRRGEPTLEIFQSENSPTERMIIELSDRQEAALPIKGELSQTKKVSYP